MKTIQPINDNVVLKIQSDSEEKTAGGIYIPDTAKEKPQEGEVIGVSTEAQSQLSVGDKVIFKKYSGTETSINGQDLVIVTIEDILAKIVEADAIPD